MPHRRTALLACLSLALLGACESYDLTVNERVVYAPPGLFRDFAVTDPALRDCVTQAISDQGVTRAEELTVLNCSHAGIDRLEGLGIFVGITQLKLSSNRVRNLLELQPMQRLEILQLDDNRVVDPVPLYRLGALRSLDLSSNPALQCPDPGSLATLEQIALPDHCPEIVVSSSQGSPRQ